MTATHPGSLRTVEDLDPPSFVGGPQERATAVVAHYAGRISSAEVNASRPILDDPDARHWVDACIRFVSDAFPEELAYIDATAAARGTTLEAVFATQHRSYFPPAESPAFVAIPPDDDGCAVGASRIPGRGAWVVKNRDNNPDILRRHIVSHHVDPSWGGHALLATSTAGGPTAASGGINTRGFCVVSTAITTRRPPPGVQRTFLMGGLLARCATVDEALDIVGNLPHLGGTITMGDATGAIATVELEPDAILIERAGWRPWVSRTNHTCSRSVEPDREAASEDYRRSSVRRLSTMQSYMVEVVELEQNWETIEPWIADRMTTHGDDGAVCRHEGNATTIATSIFTCDPPSMLTSIGPGCEGRWGRWTHTSTL